MGVAALGYLYQFGSTAALFGFSIAGNLQRTGIYKGYEQGSGYPRVPRHKDDGLYFSALVERNRTHVATIEADTTVNTI